MEWGAAFKPSKFITSWSSAVIGCGQWTKGEVWYFQPFQDAVYVPVFVQFSIVYILPRFTPRQTSSSSITKCLLPSPNFERKPCLLFASYLFSVQWIDGEDEADSILPAYLCHQIQERVRYCHRCCFRPLLPVAITVQTGGNSRYVDSCSPASCCASLCWTWGSATCSKAMCCLSADDIYT